MENINNESGRYNQVAWTPPRKRTREEEDDDDDDDGSSDGDNALDNATTVIMVTVTNYRNVFQLRVMSCFMAHTG